MRRAAQSSAPPKKFVRSLTSEAGRGRTFCDILDAMDTPTSQEIATFLASHPSTPCAAKAWLHSDACAKGRPLDLEEDALLREALGLLTAALDSAEPAVAARMEHAIGRQLDRLGQARGDRPRRAEELLVAWGVERWGPFAWAETVDPTTVQRVAGHVVGQERHGLDWILGEERPASTTAFARAGARFVRSISRHTSADAAKAAAKRKLGYRVRAAVLGVAL